MPSCGRSSSGRRRCPERTVASLTSQSLPALRAYLDGRAAYRRARTREAIAAYSTALDRDSTFALAALDLAVATTRLMRQRVCFNRECRWAGTFPGFRDEGEPRDDALFDRAIRLAWDARARLSPRDALLLEALHDRDTPPPRGAREMIGLLEQAANAAPDRADVQYLLGLALMYQGPAIGRSDALVLAEARLLQAIALDPAYLAPRARLVDVAGFEGDMDKLRRAADEYLVRDPSGPVADYVRWRVAAGTSDANALAAVRARFDSLDRATLRQVMTASQLSGVALADAERAAVLLIRRAPDPFERSQAFLAASTLALNQGRPHLADSLLRMRQELDTVPTGFWQSTVLAALYNDGDTVTAVATARARERWLAGDTAGKARLHAQESTQAYQQGLWAWSRGRLDELEALAAWLKRQDASRLYSVDAMLLATSRRTSDAEALRARVDSESRSGCCAAPHTADLSLASAYQLVGNDSAALAAVRRGRWVLGTSFLATYLRTEGRLAATVGDHDGALRAYGHYLALRADPEPALLPQRDSVRAEVARLQRGGRGATP